MPMEASRTNEYPDPLLLGRAYCIGWGRGLSAYTWRVLDAECADVLIARRGRDAVRSVLTLSMIIILVGWLGGLAAAGTLGGGASAAMIWSFAGALLVSVALGPVVMLRRRRPVMVLDAEGNRELMRIEHRTRFALAANRFEVRASDGSMQGLLVRRLANPLRTRWSLELADGRAISLSDVSLGGALKARAIAGSRLLRSTRLMLAVLREREDHEPAPILVATDDASGEPLARCLRDPTGDWLWLVMEDHADAAARPPILGAALLAAADE